MSENIIKITGMTHSKHRNAFGLVGINVVPAEKMINVVFARQWMRDQLNEIPYTISKLYNKIKWDKTYVDQFTGEHFIADLKKKHNIPLSVITTGKNLKDPKEIEKVQTMDMTEMVQFLLSVKQNRQIRFTTKPKGDLEELESQIALFTEHKTEQGNVAYFAPGDELDSLTKSLLVASFAARKYITGDDGIAYGGPVEDDARNAELELAESLGYSSQI